VDAYSTSKYERIARIIATSQAGTTVFRWNPMPNWRKLPSSLYMNRGLNACTAAKAAKKRMMEKDVMCCLMKNWFTSCMIIILMCVTLLLYFCLDAFDAFDVFSVSIWTTGATNHNPHPCTENAGRTTHWSALRLCLKLRCNAGERIGAACQMPLHPACE